MANNIRPETMERITTPALARAFIDEQLAALRAQIGEKKVLLALSGGVDSSVVAALLIKAVGKQLTCVHVNHGLLRKGEPEQVIRVFRDEMDANLIYVDAVDRFLDKLAGVAEPEQKRKIIGAEFIRVFEEEARKLDGIEFLAQGTIYPDILESGPVKAHHNVGGLPEDLQFELVEPLKFLYKDEVRVVGHELGLPDNMVYRQPFPGPGLGVRCVGAITRDRLEAVRESDAILREEFAKNGLAGKVWQYFTIVPEGLAVFHHRARLQVHRHQGRSPHLRLARGHPCRQHPGRRHRHGGGRALRPAAAHHRPHHQRGQGREPRPLRPDPQALWYHRVGIIVLYTTNGRESQNSLPFQTVDKCRIPVIPNQ